MVMGVDQAGNQYLLTGIVDLIVDRNLTHGHQLGNPTALDHQAAIGGLLGEDGQRSLDPET